MRLAWLVTVEFAHHSAVIHVNLGLGGGGGGGGGGHEGESLYDICQNTKKKVIICCVQHYIVAYFGGTYLALAQLSGLRPPAPSKYVLQRHLRR